MKNIVRIKGDKVNLCVVRVDEEAFEKYMTWMNDEDIVWRLGRNNRVLGFNEERKYIASDDEHPEHRFNIVVAETDELIGNCDVRLDDMKNNGCIGICIGEASTHEKGYGTEVMQLLLKFCFDELHLHNVWLQANSENTRAIHVYEKVGFRTIGVEKEVQWVHGHYTDTVHMQILEQWYRELPYVQGVTRNT